MAPPKWWVCGGLVGYIIIYNGKDRTYLVCWHWIIRRMIKVILGTIQKTKKGNTIYIYDIHMRRDNIGISIHI